MTYRMSNKYFKENISKQLEGELVRVAREYDLLALKIATNPDYENDDNDTEALFTAYYFAKSVTDMLMDYEDYEHQLKRVHELTRKLNYRINIYAYVLAKQGKKNEQKKKTENN